MIPADLTPGEIDARLGAAWIDKDYVEQFLLEILDDVNLRVEHPGGQIWKVHGNMATVPACSTWGTSRYPAPALAQAVLEQRPIEVHDTVTDPAGRDRSVLNADATVAAQEKAAELGERFADWAWEDPARAAALARTYNDRFNSLVLRSYDDATLSLPGLALTFRPRPHQVAAVARIIGEPAVLLAHEVGAGKTAEMIMGITELRRLGLVRKPAVVVPNHMLEQFAREWLQLYPQAKVMLAGQDDLQRDRRRQFVARCATGNWDGIVMSRSAFERIPLSAAEQQAYMDRELAQFRQWITEARKAHSTSVKKLEGMLLRAQERIKAKLDSAKDPGITFEATGVDYLCIDEAHGYKNLRTPSNIRDAAIDGSQRASDLDMKIDYLRRRNGRRVVTFATATPDRQLGHRGLRDAALPAARPARRRGHRGVRHLGRHLRPGGLPGRAGPRRRQQLPDEKPVRPVRQRPGNAADAARGRRRQDRRGPGPARPRPQTARRRAARTGNGQRRAVRRPARLRPRPRRAGRPGPQPGRAARRGQHAQDLRRRPPRRAGPAAARPAADHPGQDRRGRRPDRRDLGRLRRRRVLRPRRPALPGRGSLQLVFCDLGTPGPGWNAYDELRDQLTARGLPPEKVRFIHEAKTDRDKARLFAACRTGAVAVLIGSTEKMGVGTNVQDRAIALHHLDAPWRPADVAQREGRILRQGNLNRNLGRDVEIIRYVTERSFDGYMWQTLERKARFIDQVMHGRLDTREIADIGDTALSFSEVKAIATGNPLLIDKAEADAALARLQRAERAHLRNQDALRYAITEYETEISRLTILADAVDTAIARRQDTRGDNFTMTIDGTHHTKRADAGQHVKHILEREASQAGRATAPGRQHRPARRVRRQRRGVPVPRHHQSHHRP